MAERNSDDGIKRKKQTMRLIDADALVKSIVKRLCIRSEEYLTAQESVIVSEIYNAPTIEPKTKVIAQITFDENKIREMVESQSEAEITIEIALNDCKTKHNGCENCGTECMWRDKPQTDDGTAFIKRHGLRVDYGDEVPYDLKPFIDW